jgi:hypothetical protein
VLEESRRPGTADRSLYRTSPGNPNLRLGVCHNDPL